MTAPDQGGVLFGPFEAETAAAPGQAADVHELARTVQQAWNAAFTGAVDSALDYQQARIAVETLLAAQERPAPPCPGCESLRRQCSELAGEVGILAGALREIQDAHETGTHAHDTAHAALDVLHGLRPRPAPGTVQQQLDRLTALLAVTAAERDSLAQALDERNRQLDAFTHTVRNVTNRPALAALAAAVRADAGMTVIDGFSKPAGQ